MPINGKKNMPNCKRVLVTGAAGFVGSHVVRYILDNTDWEVVCLCRMTNKGDLKNLQFAKENPRVDFVYHDLKFDLNESVRDYIGYVDYILHL